MLVPKFLVQNLANIYFFLNHVIPCRNFPQIQTCKMYWFLPKLDPQIVIKTQSEDRCG